jgi:hypothetical protein
LVLEKPTTLPLYKVRWSREQGISAGAATR